MVTAAKIPIAIVTAISKFIYNTSYKNFESF